jgi:hypothetical protein
VKCFKSQPKFRRNMLQGTACFHAGFDLKIEATYSSETSVDIQLTTRSYMPENKTLLFILNFSRQAFKIV